MAVWSLVEPQADTRCGHRGVAEPGKRAVVGCMARHTVQIPGYAELQGDIRLTPFYSFTDVKAKLEAYVADINANIDKLPGQST